MIGYIYYPVNISNLCWLIIAFKRNLENWIKNTFPWVAATGKEKKNCIIAVSSPRRECEIILNKFFGQLIPIHHFSFAPLEGETFTVNITVSLYFFFFILQKKPLRTLKMSLMSLDPCSGAHHVPESPPLFCGNCGHVSPFPVNLSTRRLTVS